MLEKRKSVELIDSSNKRQRIDKEIGCLSLNIDVPTRVNGSWHLEGIHADEQLHPLEVWVVHFSCEDDLKEKGLNVVHFWHDKGFLNVRMSSKSLDATGEFSEIIDQQILS
ncbi:hypothetical protein C2G38_2254123 [Gigaspora rosea]|uniref:Uncharacterized protein n=1 Tax=Gigaspora rosea TaxID=44941 RepID=A0A397U708_9GLOM|nr:hypothetical protein C2G38_2254123 [Gigaspora rosea]